jgi:hypothetical protein
LQRALYEEETRRTPVELAAGLEPRAISVLLAEHEIERAAAALVVCFEGAGLGLGEVVVPRASRMDVRLLERAFLIDNLSFVIATELDARELDVLDGDPFELA